MASGVILIGPIGTGKSTIARLLARRLGLPQQSLDEHRWRYYAEVGFDRAVAHRLMEHEDFSGLFHYWNRFDAHAVERILTEYPGCIIDFGAGHSVHPDPASFARVQQALAPYPYVVLLLPSPDVAESLRILDERGKETVNGVELSEHFVRHPSSYYLADVVVETKGKHPETLRDEIAKLVGPVVSNLVLMGPEPKTNKAVGALLAQTLQIPHIPLEQLMQQYRTESGFDRQQVRQLWETEGYEAIHRYFKPFDVLTVERVVAEHTHAIIDLEPRLAVYEEPEHVLRVQAAFAPHTVVLLVPSLDQEEAITILRQRKVTIDGMAVNEFFLRHPSNDALAKQTVYTKAKTPDETCEEIVQLIRQQSPITGAGSTQEV